jgi:hypothetical protein
MSNKAYNWALNIPLKGGQKSLLLIIANAIGKDGTCYPGTDTLIAWSGYSRRAVIQYINDLIDNKIIKRKYQHDKKGYRKKTIYCINFDLKIEKIKRKILNANIAPRKKKSTSLSANNADLSANNADLSANNAPSTYIEPEYNPKKNHDDFSVDNFNDPEKGEKIKIIIGVKFEQLCKINEDSYNLQNARRLFFKLCLEKDSPLQFADNLIITRKQQICDFNKLTKSGKLVPTPCSLFKWLEGERWLDIVKPLGEKKKVSPYVRCGCGEEYLRGGYCGRCAELKKSRMQAYG